MDTAREKLVQLYQFLKAFHERRYKVPYRIDDHRWHMWFRDLPDHPSIRVIDSEDLDSASQRQPDEYRTDGEQPEASLAGNIHAHADDSLLNVRRPNLTDAPAPPEEIVSWLEPGWTDVDSEPSYKPERQDVLGAGPVPIAFREDPERLRLWDEWIERHRRWVEVEKPARRAMDTYERLYALYSELERESESVELVLGDGLLVWQMSESEFVRHPLLLQRVELRFDPSVPEFAIYEAGSPPELYTPLLNSIPSLTAASVGRIADDEWLEYYRLETSDSWGLHTEVMKQ